MRLRSKDEIPLARDFVGSPYDVDARLSRKRSTYWVGYKVHLTEMCDEDLPLVITHVETSPATTQDFDLVRDVHDALDERELPPDEHLIDMGHLSADLLVSEKQDHSVTLIGPARDDQKWQAWAGKGFAAKHFKVDWDEQRMTCPAGRTSASWTEAQDARGRPVIKIKVAIGDCRSCEDKLDCTKASRRTVTLQAQERHEALLAWRAQEDTEAFKALYAKRAGVEGTVSVGVRDAPFALLWFCQDALATSRDCLLNLLGAADWLAEKPRAVTRLTAFERMLHMAA